jgi:hypothetical protein
MSGLRALETLFSMNVHRKHQMRDPLMGTCRSPGWGRRAVVLGSRRRQQVCPPKRARSAPYRGKEFCASQQYFG